ncbi:hypothetical protein DY023_05105 [Microbacterium bovistercoris]|uniref:Uncharacterized protein n=1 Tax=Microbacterium bovistercoris TaxID=2293570 RepID=A0A371NVP9_9MICO|nr:hypothetical protein [Microbacterium bovistercoris]REJ06735.1 hypothetical protein DY023_05105 [Microbacterium bovistercoris]
MNEYNKTVVSRMLGTVSGLEVQHIESHEQVAEVFEDSETGRRTVNLFEIDVPLEVIEWLLAEARAKL